MCDSCGGPTGWILVQKDEWKKTKKLLDKCSDCGHYSFCSYCARSEPDIKYIRGGDDGDPKPITGANEKLIIVRKSWCGPY